MSDPLADIAAFFDRWYAANPGRPVPELPDVEPHMEFDEPWDDAVGERQWERHWDRMGGIG